MILSRISSIYSLNSLHFPSGNRLSRISLRYHIFSSYYLLNITNMNNSFVLFLMSIKLVSFIFSFLMFCLHLWLIFSLFLHFYFVLANINISCSLYKRISIHQSTWVANRCIHQFFRKLLLVHGSSPFLHVTNTFYLYLFLPYHLCHHLSPMLLAHL